MSKSISEALGLPRPVLLGIAIVGLVGFVAIMGVATHSGLTTLWPGIPGWMLIVLSLLAPVLFLLGVGVVGALHETESTRPTMRKVSSLFQLLVILGFIVWMVGKAVGLVPG